MKRLFVLLTLIVMATIAFSGCKSNDNVDDGPSDNTPLPCTHTSTTAKREKEVKSTCTEGGSYEEAIYCLDCNVEISRTSNTVDPLGHKASAVNFTEDFCQIDPVATLKCSRCNIFMGEFGHNYVKTVVHPDCFNDGYEHYKCSKCGNDYTETIKSQGHIESEWEIKSEPSCYKEGVAVKKCLVCKAQTDQKTIEKLEHHYKTELIGGKIVYTCYECSYTETQNTAFSVYTVSFVENGGSDISDISVIENSTPNLPVTSQDGYVFVGWYYDEELTKAYSDAAINENLTLYAKFEKIEIIEDEKDIIIGAPLDYTFMVVSNTPITEENLGEYISVTTLGEVSVPLHIISSSELGDPVSFIYKIGGDYQSGENYFITLTSASFLDRESNTLWIKTEGDKENVVTLKEDVYPCSTDEIYGIFESGDDMVLMMYSDFLAKDQIVAFYDGDSDAYILGVKIKDIAPLNNYTAYTIEVLQIEDLFEECDISESDKVNFENAEINKNLAEEISSAFKNSELYAQYLDTVTAVAKKYGSSVGPVDFNVQFFAKGDIFTIKLSASAELEEDVAFIMDYYINLGFDFDFSLNGEKSTLILNTDMVNSVQLNVAFDQNELHGTQYTTRNALLREYKTLFNEIKERNMKLSPSSEKGKGNPESYFLAKIPIKCGAVTAYLTLNGEFDFSMMGGLSAELKHTVKSTIGIRNGEPINDYTATLESISGVAYSGIDVYGGIKVSLDVGFCGLYGYIDGSVGLRGELIASAALTVSEQNSYVLGSYSFDSSVIMESNLGVKYHINLFGFEKKVFDTSAEVLKVEIPFIKLGGNYVSLHFTDESNSTPDSALNIGRVNCELDINLKGKIDSSVLVLDVDNFKPSTKKDLNCDYVVNVMLGNVKARVKSNGMLKITGTGEFLLSVTVKYSGVVEKTVYVKGTANHKFTKTVVDDDLLLHEATCHSKAVYYTSCVCGTPSLDQNATFEYGEYDEHHIIDAYFSDENSHWKKCDNAGCNYKDSVTSHEYEKLKNANAMRTESTCYTKESYYMTCSVCKNISQNQYFEVGTLKEHRIQSQYSSNENSHWKACAESGCDYKENQGNHTFIQDVKDEHLKAEAGCNTPAVYYLSCSVCNTNGTTTFNHGEVRGHRYPSSYACQTRNCKDCSHVEARTYHKAIKNGYCECGLLVDNPNVTFEYDQTTNSYKVTKYSDYRDSTGLVTRILVPHMYNGKPVTMIEAGAFSGNTSITFVEISDTVTSIGKGAFMECTKLSQVEILGDITELSENIFKGCEKLTNFVIPSTVKTIGTEAFEYCNNLTNINIPESVETIKSKAFKSCKNLSSVTIKNGVKTIEEEAFGWCTNLSSITIPKSVTSIGELAFSFSNLSTIKYGGTKNEWNAIAKGKWWNQVLTSLITVNCIDGYKEERYQYQ